MNYITLDFERILVRMAKERGLEVKNVAGTLDFKGADMHCVKVTFDINEWQRRTIVCQNEQTFEDSAEEVLNCYFHVPTELYALLARAKMEGRDLKRVYHGYGVEFYLSDQEELIVTRDDDEVCDDFDADMLREVYDRLADQQEEADRTRYLTECQLRMAM